MSIAETILKISVGAPLKRREIKPLEVSLAKWVEKITLLK
jgi:hypothetical protein